MGIRKSIVLITVDCLRADHVGFMGYPRPVTPFLDSLAPNSVVFSDAIVTGAPTYFSLPGIFASRYPLSLGREILGIAPSEPTLATALHAAGAKTAAFLAGNPYLSPRFGYEQGFDRFKDFLSAIPGKSVLATTPENQRLSSWNRRIEALSHKTPLTAAAYDEVYFWYCQWVAGRQQFALDQLRRYPAADVVMDQACSWLRDLGQEHFFLWVHLMDPHNPYFPPQEALSALGDTALTARRARSVNAFWRRSDVGPHRLQQYREEIVSLYDAGVYWVDKQMSRLAETLQQLQKWRETVLVVTADHGEEFLEHGGARYHSPENLPEQLIHVPLLLRAPGLSGSRISQQPFSLIHLAPTLLEAVGVPVPDNFQGRSRWEQISAGTLPDEPAIAESAGEGDNPLKRNDGIRPRVLAVRDSRFKLVTRFGEKADYLYDLNSDPEEKSPLPPGTLIGERARLLRVAHAHLQKSRQNRNAEFVLDARLREIKQSIATKCG